MESILHYVSRRLREVKAAEWEAIRLTVGDDRITGPKKLAFERENTNVTKLEPYYRYFLLRDYGLPKLPHENGAITKRNGAR